MCLTLAHSMCLGSDGVLIDETRGAAYISVECLGALHWMQLCPACMVQQRCQICAVSLTELAISIGRVQ